MLGTEYRKNNAVLIIFLAFILSINILAEEWPTYRFDTSRSGKTTNKLKFPIQKIWKYKPAQFPCPAWPEPGDHENNRVDFDYAHQAIIANSLVIFGSTADDTVRALELTTGKLKWSFTTDGPVRFAPQVVEKRVYFTSDDGFLYCLDLISGKELWRFQGAIRNDMLLGNGRMISRWPLRSGVLVDNGVIYITAGIWPSEGIFIYALDSKNGKIIWCNDSSGAVMMPGKHYASWELSGISPQGYMSASSKILVVPTGRGYPCQFDRETGKFLTPNHSRMLDPRTGKLFSINAYNTLTNSGGVWSMVVEEKGVFISAGSGGNGFANYLLYDSPFLTKKKMKEAPFPIKISRSAKRAVVTEKNFFSSGGEALILAGNALIEGTIEGLTGRDIIARKSLIDEIFKDDEVRGLAVADGHLIVSTREGNIICYGPKREGMTSVKLIQDTVSEPKSQSSIIGEKLVKLMLERKIVKGYALLVDPKNVKIAEALANKTQLHVIVVMKDAEKVKAERQRLLTTTGLYGSRIAIHHIENFEKLPFGPYFANLVVVAGKDKSISEKELYRVLRPCGGIMTFIDAAKTTILNQKPRLLDNRKNTTVERAITPTGGNQNVGIPTNEISKWRNLELVTRGKLPGAFDWDSKPSTTSKKSNFPWKKLKAKDIITDKRVKWPLELLWYGGIGPAIMNNRHWSPTTPIPANGRYFVVGKNHIIAADAYNGTMLWEQKIQNAATKTTPLNIVAKTSSPSLVKSLYANDDSVYVNLDGTYIQYDAQTGKQKAVFGDIPLSKNFSLITPQTFTLKIDEQHSGTITISKDSQGLKIILKTKDPSVTWHDEWELYFDFRPMERRFGTYSKGAFQALVFIDDKDYYKRKRPLKVRFCAGTVHPKFTIARKKIKSGVEITLTISSEEMDNISGKKTISFGFFGYS